MSGRALVIGGAGFLGSGIVQELLAAGWSVTSLGRGNKPNQAAGVRFIQADRTQPGGLARVLGDERFDLVVDCAAYQRPDAEEAVIAFAGRTGHYVFISTDFVYSPEIAGPFPIQEDAPKETERRYGVGKLACEAVLAEAWRSRQFPCTTLRPPHILGAGNVLGTGSVTGRDKDLLGHMRAGSDLTLLAEGLLLIAPVRNREVGSCIAHIACKPAAFGQIFNCTGPDAVTTRVYYEIIARRLGVPLRYDTMSVEEFRSRWPDKAPHARHRLYSLRKLEDLTGYRPHFDLEGAIAETMEWLERR
jgi:nucleoside-diphosphate-sugar epimerase